MVSSRSPERTDSSSRPSHTGSLAFLPPATPSSHQPVSSIPPFPVEWVGRSLLLRMGFSLVPGSRQNWLVYPSPGRKDLARSRAPSEGPRPPALRTKLTGSLATVKRRSPSRLYLICVMDRSWPCSRIGFCGDRTGVSAPRIGPCPRPGPPRQHLQLRTTHHPRGDTRKKAT